MWKEDKTEGKDIRHNNGLLLLNWAERVFFLVLPRVQSVVPQLWNRSRRDIILITLQQLRKCEDCFVFAEGLRYKETMPNKGILMTQ